MAGADDDAGATELGAVDVRERQRRVDRHRRGVLDMAGATSAGAEHRSLGHGVGDRQIGPQHRIGRFGGREGPGVGGVRHDRPAEVGRAIHPGLDRSGQAGNVDPAGQAGIDGDAAGLGIAAVGLEAVDQRSVGGAFAPVDPHPVEHHGVGGIAFGHVQRQRRRGDGGADGNLARTGADDLVEADQRGLARRTVVGAHGGGGAERAAGRAVVDVGVLRAGIAGAAVTEAQRADLHDDAAGGGQRATGAAAAEIADREADRRAALIGRRRRKAQPVERGVDRGCAAAEGHRGVGAAIAGREAQAGRARQRQQTVAIAGQRELQQRRIDIGHLRRTARGGVEHQRGVDQGRLTARQGERRRVVDRGDRHRDAAGAGQRTAAALRAGVAVGQRPGQRHAGRRRVGAVPVDDVAREPVDAVLRGLRAEADLHLAAGEGVGADLHAVDEDRRTADGHHQPVEGELVLGLRAALTRQRQRCTGVAAGLGQIGIVQAHVGIEHDRGAALGPGHRAAQRRRRAADARIERAVGQQPQQQRITLRTIGRPARNHQPAVRAQRQRTGAGTRANRLLDDAALAEAGVERAVGQMAHQRDPARAVVAGQHDAAAGIAHHRLHEVRAAQIGRHPAVAGKAGVDAAVGQVAQQREVNVAARLGRIAAGEDAAVVLHHQRADHVEAASDIGAHDAAAAEAGIQRAVVVPAHQGMIVAGRAAEQDAAIGLDRQRADQVGGAAGIDPGIAVAAAEGGVEHAVGRHPRDRGRAAERAAQHDASLRVDRHRAGLAELADIAPQRSAVTGETGVEAAVGQVALHQRVLHAANRGLPGQNNRAVSLHRHRPDLGGGGAEARGRDRDPATAAKGGVERAVGPVAHQQHVLAAAGAGLVARHENAAVILDLHRADPVVAAADRGDELAAGSDEARRGVGACGDRDRHGRLRGAAARHPGRRRGDRRAGH
ncbi:hypothetical protein X805_39880 [Sphaerotilus natans subsp. natans DSM 6575]|uniref:Uncharacterized protein n=1 Tax=Sphaerotilus natans subsp. natans DSM 6575 TaxID=1286631 RepID=A0A059KGR8_9BURK|nr:hypothetical protein X805_39880 [Sphaerotilus natans subsp. natans DSM 6575]